ncbi:mitochondrial 54S ribosomal protein YmL31 [Pneumocystis jirovecii RU7]|uniref:54S ribosomal protein L31, mitochondrial n=1 Tax=Pneumocystis jirovecii (strain RU7) TaxID=1408657 RepID=A0A0W4ZIU1_PNEJ7|nr:mitochondrial 54S ribosomal protein YmL31 [Pneumocystis jirovecii RU7]KTW28294.1 hypothetical protein T551_02713 [Pneumocystis jirovecii RU7]
MFGPFKTNMPIFSGLLWKMPWRLSKTRKLRQRRRLRKVDLVISTLQNSLAKKGLTCHALERHIREIIPEAKMLPKDKYTVFDKKKKEFRKGIHFVPKFTKVTIMNRMFPPGF